MSVCKAWRAGRGGLGGPCRREAKPGEELCPNHLAGKRRSEATMNRWREETLAEDAEAARLDELSARTVAIVFTPPEFEALRTQAARVGMTPADWAKREVTGALGPVVT